MGSDVTTVAFDVGPLHGALSGVGVATLGMRDALSGRPDVRLVPYVLSARAALQPGVRRLPLPAALAHRAWARTSLPRVDRWLRPAQVVHGTNYVAPPSRLPRLVSVYDCWFLRHPDEVAPGVRRAGEVLRRAVATGAHVHASSEATAAEVRALLGTDRVHVVPLGAPPPAARAGSAGEQDATTEDRTGHGGRAGAPAGPPFVLALGTTERRKNLPALVEAFGCLSPAVGDAELVIAGADGDDRPAIESAVDALAPARRQRVRLVGRVDDEAKARLLATATVLAYPSLDEGFGFPLLEAMAAGLPIVASRAGSIPEVAGDAALLVEATDVDGLAGALERVVTDEAERARLVAAGRVQRDRFSWATTAEQLAALYHALAAGDR